ncbi:hypothetical protein PAGU2638_21380 [Lysobacter sp. PAGU 2638]
MRVALATLLSVALAACGHDAASNAGTTVPPVADDDALAGTLPTPAATPGSAVTAMPTQPPPPGAAVVAETPAAALPTDATAATPTDVATDPNALPAPVDAGTTDAAPAPNAASAAPTDTTAPAPAPPPVSAADASAAASVVNQYMAALGANAPARAQGLWSTTPNDSAVLQLARGTTFNVGVGAPSADAGGHVTVPVDVRGTADDGGDRHVQVTYTLQRTQAGAWRILSANVRDAAP